MQSTSSFAEGSFLSPKLTLDMSFNRNPEGRFASDVDPLDQQAPDFVAPVPTFEGILDEMDGLDEVLETWKFPLRTDFARGIIWGPFRHYRGNSYADLATPEAAIEDLRSYDEHAMFPARPQPIVRRQRIFPILRTPEATSPTVVNSLSSSLVSESSSSHSATESHFSTSTQSSCTTNTSVTISVKTSSTKASSRSAKKSAAAASSSSASSTKRRRKTVAPSTRPPRPSRAAAIKARNSFRLQARYLRKPSQPRKPKFVGIDISLPISRIRLCATSLLKYGDL
ncbi:hypothetical protein PCASD_20095 [Puccinia coronata f. sp. avenae]|uniref:Uncharacterized protein n=1 Tax=Puccinia coronata f. sp. avenae TaxID=200324 RepID=A0A2N5U5F6_9BASI|nr:hypothetical protein PCASD_20095 [Puccinia coronata f. sp. avenae]